MKPYDEELVDPYLNQIAALALRAEAGDNVAIEVLRVIDSAAQAFADAQTSSAKGNLTWLAAQLQILANTASRQDWAKTTFDYAIGLVREKIQSR